MTSFLRLENSIGERNVFHCFYVAAHFVCLLFALLEASCVKVELSWKVRPRFQTFYKAACGISVLAKNSALVMYQSCTAYGS